MTLSSLRDLFDNQIEYLPDTVFDSLENLINLWVIYIFCYCYTIIFLWCLHYMRMTRFAIIYVHLFTLTLDILARWKTRRAISHFWLHSVVVLLTRRIFFFFFFLFDIIATGRYTKINWKFSTRKYSSPTSIWKRCKLSLLFDISNILWLLVLLLDWNEIFAVLNDKI